MSWAIVRRGFDEPLLIIECDFSELDERIPVEYQTAQFEVVPV